ncbi:MAG TPA: hypothetical protein PLX89_09050 [Verrucomicrobiota bacterium]|nr:hypothetical protein [Verrucomicrobiota bacterium]
MSIELLESNREQLTFERIQKRDELIAKNILVTDPRRQRPLWFDGRFLAASDLRNEQNYFLLRQSDLGRAGGEGVVEGLLVKEGDKDANGAEALIIDPGFGYTDTGELVAIGASLSVVPSDVPKAQQVDAAFGLEVIPNDSGRTRTGLFVLALRPVEWTANSIAAYPTSLNGQRHVEDADIIEAAAVSLIPWPDEAGELSWARRRSRAARDIFVGQRERGLTTGTLPLALVALRGNLIEWVDPFLVRRELGADRREGLDFGFGSRPLREAHLLQYERQLGEILTTNPSAAFAATAQFDALPPAGRIPSGSVNAATLTQQYFPRGIETFVSFVPEDELPALFEESFLLPPIDLQLPEKSLLGISVLILAPLKRSEFVNRRRALAGKTWRLAFAGPDSKVEATPFELLFARTAAITAAESKLVSASGIADAAAEREWRALLAQASSVGNLWYVRRRHLPIDANVAGTPVDATPAEAGVPEELVAVLADEEGKPLADAIAALSAQDAREVDGLLARLASPKLLANDQLLLRGILGQFVGRTAEQITVFEALQGLAPVTDEAFGSGFLLVGGAGGAELAKAYAATPFFVKADTLLREVNTTRLARLNDASVGLAEIVKTPRTLAENFTTLQAKLFSP